VIRLGWTVGVFRRMPMAAEIRLGGAIR
jgi:hypothetical protein